MSTLARELDHAERELRRWQTIVDYLRERAGDTNGASSNGAARKPRTRRQRGRVTAAVAAEEVLAGADGPMRTPDLLAAIHERGAQLKDSDSLYKTLSRSPRFVKAGRGLWKLAD